MNRKYYFTDETSRFRSPIQPEEGQSVRLRFQTAEADSVRIWLIHGDERQELMKAEVRGDLCLYETEVCPEGDYSYYYEIHEFTSNSSVSTVCYYDKRGVVTDIDTDYAFVIRPGYVVPEWIHGAVMYQIFTDRFRNGDNRNDVQDREYIYIEKSPVERVQNWDSVPHTLDVSRFYGGDLPGIREKLDYLQNMGVEVLYLNPIFVSPSNHKYDSQDYDNVDPHLTVIREDGGKLLPEGATDNKGASRYRKRVTDSRNLEASNAYFVEFVEEIHRRGMKIILDGVFNHCGSFNRWFDQEGFYRNEHLFASQQGAWHNPKSRYRNYFNFRTDGSYEAWWDVKTLPKLNFEKSEELQNEILRIAKKWVSPPYNVDGWRLDVAADLGHDLEFNHKFWQKFRQAVKEVNPNAVILAEHYGDASPWLSGGEWDTLMNYDAFMEPVSWYLTGMEKHSDSFREDLLGNAEHFWHSMIHNMARLGNGSLYGAMNQLDNHDHSRFLTRTNHQVGRLATVGADLATENVDLGVLRQAVVIQMMWPGAPTLYYGDETGVCGWTDPDSRRTYPWGKENWQLIEFYKYAIGIHRRNSCIRTGSLAKLYSGDRVIAFGRFDENGQVVTVVNAGSGEKSVSLDLSVMGAQEDGAWFRIMMTTPDGYNVGHVAKQLRGKVLDLVVPAHSAGVFRNMNAKELEQYQMNEQQ